MFRYFTMYSFDYYLPSFILGSYPEYATEFSESFAIITVGMGITVSLASGVIADKYSQDSPRTFANMCIASSLLAMPFYSIGVLTHDNFWLSMFGITGYYLGALFWSP